MFAVPMQSGSTLKAGRPQALSRSQCPSRASGVGPTTSPRMDGSSIIRNVQSEGGGTPSNIIVVLNWLEELKRLVPTS